MKKLHFNSWLDKYFEKDDDNAYYSWTYTDDGMHPNDKTRWKDDDLLDEHERYFNNDISSYIGLEEYDE
jgi:hypothetical protein